MNLLVIDIPLLIHMQSILCKLTKIMKKNMTSRQFCPNHVVHALYNVYYVMNREN